MGIMQCECGSYLISIDLSTGKSICLQCKSSKLNSIDEYTFIKQVEQKDKRIQKKINLLDDDEDTNVDWT